MSGYGYALAIWIWAGYHLADMNALPPSRPTLRLYVVWIIGWPVLFPWMLKKAKRKK